MVCDRLATVVASMCVHHRLNYAAVSQSDDQPASQPGRQAGSRPGPDRVKQQAGKQNEPQWQCKQTTARPHHSHTASCHLQSCIWLCAGRERKEEGRKSSKEKDRKSYKKKHKGRRVMAGRTGVMAVSKDEGRKVEQEGQE